MTLGIYLLAGIVFLLFILFIADLIKDAKNGNPFQPPYPGYREEFGEELFDFEVDEDLDIEPDISHQVRQSFHQDFEHRKDD